MENTKTPEEIIARVVEHFRSFPQVSGIALVGSRGRGEKVDQYSDADFLICVAEDGLQELTKGAWIGDIEKPILVFPLTMPREVRVFYSGFFDCDFHFYTPVELADAKGACPLGTYVAAGLKILYDPKLILQALAGRVQPEEDERDAGPFEINASVFWFNMAWTAKQIQRGDLFRAYRFSNWWLQQMLLELMERYTPVPGDKNKYLRERLRSDYFRYLTDTFGPMDREAMIAGLKKCAECFWIVQGELAPDLDKGLLDQYRTVERLVLDLR